MAIETPIQTAIKESQQVVRPGIMPETLRALGIVRVTAAEAKDLVGKEAAGIFIPYPNTQDKGKAYGRLRLDTPSPDGGKYHQPFGTSPHVYCLPDLALINGDLLMVEGEFKAICLTEAGFPAIGISGFYSWRVRDKNDPDKHHIEPEFLKIVQRLNPKRIVYIGEPYDDGADLPILYGGVAKVLNLSPSQHTEQIFKQVLGGCHSVVQGIGAMRNRLGDAHGKSSKSYNPQPRHAALAVNLSGAMALFLVETLQARIADSLK